MAARHFVVVPHQSGQPEKVAMKAWLKQHPEEFPDIELMPLTSHQQRQLLAKKGWQLKIGADEVLLISPDLSPRLANAYAEAAEAEAEIDALDTSDAEDGPELSFQLEHQLRDFIVANIGSISIGGRKLQLYKDPQGKDGKEYPTGVGFIDILAQDEGGAFYVFELKRGKSPDHTIGQILRYMGWLKHDFARDSAVRGVIVAKTHSDNLKYAASVVPDIYIFEYKVAFSLTQVAIPTIN